MFTSEDMVVARGKARKPMNHIRLRFKMTLIPTAMKLAYIGVFESLYA